MMYPQFTEIDPTHKDLIDSVTAGFPPYCDCQFSNLLSWSSHKSPTMISIIEGNLVVKMKEYSTDNVVVLFIGKNNVLNCVNTVLETYQKLERVPEEVVLELTENPANNNFRIREDVSNHDYILDLLQVADPLGDNLKSKRGNIRKFETLYSDHSVELLNQADPALENMFERFFHQIADEKGVSYETLGDELEAINKLLEHQELFTLPILGVMYNSNLIGFTINEILNHSTYKTALGCFGKGLRKYKGIYAYLETVTAKHLLNKEIDYINLEEDMGMPGLKESKRLWRPARLLKKYVIEKSY